MFLLKIFIILSLVIKPFLSLKPDNFCNLVQTESYGYYDSKNIYHTKIERVKCHGNYPFKCGEQKCVVYKQNCIDYLHYILSLEIYRHMNGLDKLKILKKKTELTFENATNKLKRFDDKIPNCPKVLNNWKSSDICLRRKICFEKNVGYRGFGFFPTSKKTFCFCKDEHNYQCGNIHCTIHKSACDEVLKTDFKMVSSQIINQCKNN